MRKKCYQIMAAVIVFVLAAVMMGGCADRMLTDEEIVVPREENSADLSGGIQEGISGGISEQVQAPERYVTEFSEGKVHVKVDAPIIVPDEAGFKLYHVLGRVFTQEDYDIVNQVLLEGGQLWNRDYEAMEKSNGLIKSEIEERIAQLKEQQAGNGESKIVAAKEKSYEELISEWEALLEDAPREPVIVNVPAIVNYSETLWEQEKNMLVGYATVGQKDYFVMLDNTFKEDFKWIQFEVRGTQNTGTFMPTDKETAENAGSRISIDKIKEEANELMARLGFDQFYISGEEYVQLYSFNEMTNEGKIARTGYEVHFTRELEGIPVTYTHEMGNSIGDDEVSWPYEAIDIRYNEEGLQRFSWANPYQVEAAGDEYVFLLPFSDVQNVFEKMMTRQAASWNQNESTEIFYNINEIRLGYMRVREKGSINEGTMIPVWDFFGFQNIVYNDMDEVSVLEAPYESMLTINAMDGTVIDRGLGY